MTTYTRNPYQEPMLGDLFVIGDELDADNDWKIHEITYGNGGTPVRLRLYNGKKWKHTTWFWLKLQFRFRNVKVIRRGETTVWRNPWVRPERGDIFRSFDRKLEILSVLTIPHYEGQRVAFAWRNTSSDDVPMSSESRTRSLQHRGQYTSEEYDLAKFRALIKDMAHVEAP